MMNPKALGRRLFMECWNEASTDVLEEILSPDHIFHLAGEDLVGIPAYRAMLEGYCRAFAPTFELKHVIAEDDFAAIHYVETGKFAADWVTASRVLKATGLSYSTFGVELISVRDDQISEAWPGHDSLTHFVQAGIVRFH